jgi:hypothetical protein
MPLKIPRYRVQLAPAGVSVDDAVASDTYDEHEVAILHSDQLRAEVTGPRFGLNDMQAQSLQFTTLWTWAALTRMGVEVGEFPIYKGRVLALSVIKDDVAPGTQAAADELTEAGPTPEADGTTLPSVSHESSAEDPPTGWTPPVLTR